MGRQRHTCDLSTLQGTYLFRDQGVDEAGRTFAGAGYEYFDGNGHIYGVFSHHDHGASSAHYGALPRQVYRQRRLHRP